MRARRGLGNGRRRPAAHDGGQPVIASPSTPRRGGKRLGRPPGLTRPDVADRCDRRAARHLPRHDDGHPSPVRAGGAGRLSQSASTTVSPTPRTGSSSSRGSSSASWACASSPQRPRPRVATRLLRRTWTIFFWQQGLLALLLAVVLLLPAARATLAPWLGRLAGDASGVLPSAVLMLNAPNLLDILPLYVVFMAMAPFLVRLVAQGRAGFVIGRSLTLWLMVQLGAEQPVGAALRDHAGHARGPRASQLFRSPRLAARLRRGPGGGRTLDPRGPRGAALVAPRRRGLPAGLALRSGDRLHLAPARLSRPPSRRWRSGARRSLPSIFSWPCPMPSTGGRVVYPGLAARSRPHVARTRGARARQAGRRHRHLAAAHPDRPARALGFFISRRSLLCMALYGPKRLGRSSIPCRAC